MKNGAVGGKLLGAGGGGFLLFYCPKEQQNKLEQVLQLKKFDFTFEMKVVKCFIMQMNVKWVAMERKMRTFA